MFFVYVLYSLKDHKLYKGYTENLSKRLLRHNSGGNPSTKHRRPFILVHVEQFSTRENALNREKYLKTGEGIYKLKAFLREKNILDKENRLNISITRRSS